MECVKSLEVVLQLFFDFSCEYLHGNLCDMCNRECLNPSDPEQQKGTIRCCVVCLANPLQSCSHHSTPERMLGDARERNGESFSNPRVSLKFSLLTQF